MSGDDLEKRAGKGPEDDRPEMEGGADDPAPADHADPRVAQPGQDPPGEDALTSRRGVTADFLAMVIYALGEW